jgi:hypothetical protein
LDASGATTLECDVQSEAILDCDFGFYIENRGDFGFSILDFGLKMRNPICAPGVRALCDATAG